MRKTATVLAVLVVGAVAYGQAPVVTHVNSFSSTLATPARLAPDGGGGIYVTDPSGGLVIQYDSLGVVVGSFPIAEGPLGIAVLADGRVFVSREDGQIGLYDPALVLLGTVDPTPQVLTEPNDLAVDPLAGELYAVDSGSNQVMVFGETAPNTFTLVRMWGIGGPGLGQLQTPQAIAVDPIAGRVYVTDTDNFRVQVFDTVGTLLFKFGYRTLYAGGTETAWFPRSEGITTDSCGNVYVCDAVMGTVRAFDSLGQELDPAHTPVITFGTGVGNVRGPSDIVIDNLGTLFVSSTNNGAVEVYDVVCTGAMAAVAAVDLTQRSNDPKGDRLARRGDSVPDRERLRARPAPPDNPAVIVQAILEDDYCKDLDLNVDGFVDEADLEIAVAAFGAGTVEDFHGGTVAAHPSLDPPHIGVFLVRRIITGNRGQPSLDKHVVVRQSVVVAGADLRLHTVQKRATFRKGFFLARTRGHTVSPIAETAGR